MSVNIPPAGVEELKRLLSVSEQPVTVSFLKKDGQLRVMTCTRNMELVPPSAWPKDADKQVINSAPKSEATIRVYDVKASGWRSFIIENVVGFM